MMIGKISKLNFKSLFLLITSAIIFTAYLYDSFIIFGAFILFFFISLLATKYGLKIIANLNLYQNIREVGPHMHVSKINTPTIGGIFFIIPFLLFLLMISINFYSTKILLLFFCVFGFFIIGLLDDYISIKKKTNTGLRSKEKFILQCLISLIFIFLVSNKSFINPLIEVSNSWGIYTSFMILPISFFTLVGLSNSVNLTDGLDGLASGCSSIVFYGLGTEILIKGQKELIIFSILCYSMSGLCLGFLNFNKYPAKIFMGDTGSLSIGAILASTSILTNSFFFLFIISGIFIVESLSVIMQVGFFKITKNLLVMEKEYF